MSPKESQQTSKFRSSVLIVSPFYSKKDKCIYVFVYCNVFWYLPHARHYS